MDYENEEIKISVPWGHVAGKLWNKSKGNETIICLHGWQDNLESFEHLIPRLTQKYKYLCLDLPGHGLSSNFPLSVPINGTMFVITIKLVADRMQLKKYGLMAHSFASLISLIYTTLYPEEVTTLLMIDPLALPPVSPEKTSIMMRKAVNQFLNFLEEGESEKNEYPTFNDAVKHFLEVRKDNYNKDSAELLLKRNLTLTPNGYKLNLDPRVNYSTSSQMILTLDQIQYILSSVQCMRVIITTKQTYEVMKRKAGPEMAEAVLDYAKSVGTIVQYIEGSHSVHMEYPERIADILNPLLINQTEHLNKSHI